MVQFVLSDAFLTLSPSLEAVFSRIYTQTHNLTIDSFDSIKLLWEANLWKESPIKKVKKR